MDPWLEHPAFWPDVDSRLITSIADDLAPRIAPRYFVGVGTRTAVLTDRDIDQVYHPDVTNHSTQSRAQPQPAGVALLESPEQSMPVVVPIGEEIEETFVAIQELPGRKLVTVVEVLSPTNKKASDGRADYLKKRNDRVRSRVSLVEIDLLRGGEPMPIEPPPPQTDYRVLICRAGRRKSAELIVFPWTTPIPPIPIPLLPGDAEPALDLSAVLHALIDRARYDLVVDYQRPPQPPLGRDNEALASTIIAQASNPRPDILLE
jgi:hypothetical protein